MKVAFFSRCNLVHLYGKLHEHVSKFSDVIHIAYSSTEEDILRNQYGIQHVINMENRLVDIANELKFTEKEIGELDQFIIQNSKERFNLNSTLQADRTLKYQSYENSIFLAFLYNSFWKEVFDLHEINFFFHEPTSLLMNHMAALYCSSKDIKYVSPILSYGCEKYNFIFLSGDDATFDEFDLLPEQCICPQRAIEYIDDFRTNFEMLANEFSVKESLLSISTTFVKSLVKNIFYKDSKIDMSNVLNHLEKYFKYEKSPVKTLINTLYSNYLINYDEVNEADSYIYYPLHLEPEAVVLYWGDDLYTNQVKLIENIASQLPPNCYLYVKDHPHGGGYRDYIDYSRMKSIPNVKLIDSKFNGKKLISNSLGVVTINGTSGFEALVLGKKVFTFGASWYRSFKGVKYIKNIRDLRDEIYDSLTLDNKFCEEDLVNDIDKYLRSTHKGFVNYFADQVKQSGVNELDNIDDVSAAIKLYINRL